MNCKIFLIYSLLFSFAFSLSHAQRGNVDRDEYFRRMELRALELSKKMAELTGTEPVQIIQPRSTPSAALYRGSVSPPSEEKSVYQESQILKPSDEKLSLQASFDALPGPAEPKDESRESNESHQFVDEVTDITKIVQPTSEELKGKNFLRPIFLIQAPFDSKLKAGDTFKGDLGSGVGVIVGRRIENWTMSARFGYTHQGFSSSNFLGFGFDAVGDIESLSFTGNLGIAIPLNQKLSFEASFGLGYSSVHHSLHVPNIKSLDLLSDSGFCYELSLLLDYSFSEPLSLFLGYRLAGIPENYGTDLVGFGFDSVNTHLFELGLGMNF
jgi:hypothetical protein